MAIINVLDKATVDKIAAGEVIEGPSAVVKELVENAVDAGSSQITVEIKDGGTTLIRVTDNGKGIGPDDVVNAFKAHATSKIKDASDLFGVRSLGFRGEALSSIAAVAKVEMLTKTADTVSGTRYVIEGGVEKESASVGCPEGTTFIIRDLFYNTPARRKFLKSPATEGRYIEEVMEHMAVSFPDIAFKFILNSSMKLQTPGNGRLKDVIYYMYGRNIAGSLIPVNDPDKEGELVGGISVRGYVGKPDLTRGNREYESYFVNGRYIKDKVITRAVEDAFKSFLMQHRYPFTCLLISVDSSLVDVNVHPRKLEVRFADQDDIYKRVYNSVDYALHHRELIPEAEKKAEADKKSLVRPVVTAQPQVQEEVKNEASMKEAEDSLMIKHDASEGIKEETSVKIPDIPMPEPFENRRNAEWKKEIKPLFAPVDSLLHENTSYGSGSHKDLKEASPNIEEGMVKEKTPQTDAPKAEDKVEKKSAFGSFQQVGFKEGVLSEENLKEINIVGQIFDTYWILSYGNKVYLADQHACHEKVMYEHFVKLLENKEVTSQNLMPPVVVSLSPAQAEIFSKISDYLNKLGFEVDPFGGNEYAIKAVPTELYGLSERELFFDILDQYAEEGRYATPDTILTKIATMGCKAAVKGNMKMTHEEMKELLTKMVKLDNPYNCPHGRPTMIAISKDDLEKKFKRQI